MSADQPTTLTDRTAASARRLLMRDLPALRDLCPSAAGRLRAEQFAAIHRLTPVMMLANVLNAAIASYLFWSPETATFLLLWDGLTAGTVLWGMRSWWIYHFVRKATRRSPRSVRKANLHAALLGGLWGALPLVLFPEAGAGQQLFLATLIAGMLCGGAFALSTVPSAAVIYTLILSACSISTLVIAGEQIFLIVALVTVIYSGIVLRSIAWNAELFINRFLDRSELERKSQLISLLLRDFEENASDWLWEFDADGRLQHVSARLADALERPIDALQGAVFTDLICDHANDCPVAGELIELFDKRTAFRDKLLRLQVRGEERWWSLAGKPVHDENGIYLGYRGVGADVTATKRAEDKIAYMARFDALSGLPNRGRFLDTLAEALSRPRDGECVAVLHVDLDHFKTINDTMGHATGDLLLKTVADRLRTLAGPSDMVARLSGDEFAIMHVSDGRRSSIEALADHILTAMNLPFLLDGKQAKIGASIGIAMAPEHATTADELIKYTDLALFRAKQDGRGMHRFFEPEMGEKARDRRKLANDLQSVIANDELHLAYQPLFKSDTHELSGFEALLRWKHPTRGMVSPQDFIPIAEESGLIDRIGAWVIHTACHDAAAWPAPVKVAVNLSPVQFHNPNLLNTILAALGSSGLAPGRLELEVTESVLINNAGATLDLLRSVRALGVRVALDDFGTGFSSLSYLRNYPFDKIKIDRSFIEELPNSQYSTAIVRAVAKLATDLGMTTTAEGVETKDQAALLRREGCTEMQGYLYGKPAPVADVMAYFGPAGPEVGHGKGRPHGAARLRSVK